MLRRKSANAYWNDFQQYQSFQTVSELEDTIRYIFDNFELTKSVKELLNTLKLHSKTFFGVSWLKRKEIADNSGISESAVDKAIKFLKDNGVIDVIPHNHTKRGGRAHNIYVINPVDKWFQSEASDDTNYDADYDAQPTQKEPSNPCPVRDFEDSISLHKNFNKNSNKNLNTKELIDNDSIDNSETIYSSSDEKNKESDPLQYVAKWFVEIVGPYYTNSPDAVLQLWKSTCVAAKRSCDGIHNASHDKVRSVWKKVVNLYKRGKLKNNTDDGIRGYFHRSLQDELLNDYLRQLFCPQAG
ncbi:hypothetical protein [Paenibacillus sp. NPDC093718]|uniref:hypothetical protein n=1 Tax=Paenibacillus sp. NPDC093718 TaxID=3390601 RepID=UPI003CFFB34D